MALAVGRRAEIFNLAGSLSITAALIHLAIVPEHWAEWWGYGLFFVLAALAQAVYGMACLWRAWQVRPDDLVGRLWSEHGELLLMLGILGNVLLIALYFVARTGGVPVGPSAGEIEAVTQIGIASKAIEGVLVVCLAALLARPSDRGQVVG